MNLQNIPSHNKEIRQMFRAYSRKDLIEESSDKSFEVFRWCEVETSDGFKYADKVEVGDKLIVSEDDRQLEITVIKVNYLVDNSHILFYY